MNQLQEIETKEPVNVHFKCLSTQCAHVK